MVNRQQFIRVLVSLGFVSLPLGAIACEAQENTSVPQALENEGQDTKNDLKKTGTGIKDTLQDEGVDAKNDLEKTGTGIKDTLHDAGKVPYRALEDFFTGN